MGNPKFNQKVKSLSKRDYDFGQIYGNLFERKQFNFMMTCDKRKPMNSCVGNIFAILFQMRKTSFFKVERGERNIKYSIFNNILVLYLDECIFSFFFLCFF